MILTSNVPKKEIQFLFRLSLNAMKRLWCNADPEMFLALYSIAVNLYSKIFVFEYMHLCCVGTRYFVLLQLLFLYTSAILASNYGIIISYVDCTGSLLGWYEVEKIIYNSRKFLDVDGNILMSVLLKCLKAILNLNDPARDACHLKRYGFSKALFVQSKFRL